MSRSIHDAIYSYFYGSFGKNNEIDEIFITMSPEEFSGEDWIEDWIYRISMICETWGFERNAEFSRENHDQIVIQWDRGKNRNALTVHLSFDPGSSPFVPSLMLWNSRQIIERSGPPGEVLEWFEKSMEMTISSGKVTDPEGS